MVESGEGRGRNQVPADNRVNGGEGVTQQAGKQVFCRGTNLSASFALGFSTAVAARGDGDNVTQIPTGDST